LFHVSLAGIARAAGVSESWLQTYVNDVYKDMPQTAVVIPKAKGKLTVQNLLIGHGMGISTVVKLLKGIPASRFELIEATAQDIDRIAQILEQYADSKVDFVDASVMAIAKRLNITTVLTIDQRDFSLFRPVYCPNFMLLP